MSRTRRPLGLAAAWIALLLAAPSIADEPKPTAAPKCECTERVKPIDALEHYDMIFFGEASILGLSDAGDSDREEFVEFSVEGIWKGPIQRRLRVHTNDGDPRCSFRFILGQQYLVFASLEDVAYAARYRTSACSRTTRASHALPDLAILGAPQDRLEP